jgi:prevent-host-death family protein
MKLSLKDDINSLSYFKSNFNKILKKLQNSHHPLIITQNGKSSGVFLDIETWESVLKKINLLKLINEGERSLNKEKTKTIQEVEDYFSKKYDF